MNAIGISFGLLIVLLFTNLLLHWMRRNVQITRVSITKNVPILRTDHVSTESTLPGM